MSTRNNKDKGDIGETLAAEHYQHDGYTLLEKNYTISGGELDLIFQKDHLLTFVEVKVIDNIDDIYDYVTPKKLGHLYRSIEHYLSDHPTPYEYVLDVVFVQDNSIFDIYRNVTNT